jgi:hypothetical protein
MAYDDGWIHAVFARNLVQHGAIGFYPGEWTGGTSSFLWVVLLALGLLAGLQAAVAAAVLGTTAAGVAGVVFFLLLDLELGERFAALVWALLACALGPMTYLALSGMETALFVALALLAVYAFTTSHYRVTGLLLALLVLARIESLSLAGVLCLAIVTRHRQQAVRPLLWVLFPPLVTLFLFALYNLAVTGWAVPTTMAGRKWLWGLPDATIALTPDALTHYLDTWRTYIEGWLFHVHALPPLSGVLLRVVIWGSFAAGLLFLLRDTVASVRQKTITPGVLILWWAVAHNIVYLLLSPFPSIRHQVPNLLIVVLLPAIVWRQARRHVCTRPPLLRALPAAFFLVFALALLPTSWEWQQAFADHVGHINRVHVATGKWIAANLPAEARVAAFDIGAVAYFGQHDVLDLGGLVEPDFATRYLYPRRVAQYLIEREVDYLVIPEEDASLSGVAPRLGLGDADQRGFSLDRVAAFRITIHLPSPIDTLPYYYSIPALWQMGIYHLVESR